MALVSAELAIGPGTIGLVKIAVVCPYDIGKPGGVQDQAVHLVEWLQEAGHHAWLVAPGEGGPPGTISVGRRRTCPSTGRWRRLPSTSTYPGRSSAVADADVVHIHEPFVPLVGAAALLGVTPPKVVTFHADPSSIVRGLYRVGSVLLRRWAKRAAVVTAVSPVAAAAVAPFAEARIIPNGVDTANFSGGEIGSRALSVAFLG